MALSPVEQWIAEVVPGRSFIDIGGIGEWSVNERIGCALAAGASQAAMADIEPFTSDYWRAFHERMAARGIGRDRYACHERVDVRQPALRDRLPVFDVVHSTGILYHLPDPVTALHNLCGLVGRWLVVNTVVLPERVENAHGTVTLPGSAALFLPGLSETERDVLRDHYCGKFGWSIDDVAPRPRQRDAQMPHVTDQGPSCWPYWWLFGIPAFRALVRLMRFEIRAEWTWEDHAHFLLCERIDA